MATFLFDDIIFGPVRSRRLGNSLGINLLPQTKKICNFNCLYCECGLTNVPSSDNLKGMPAREEVRFELEKTLNEFIRSNRKIDTITFAGNGEPTLHPSFSQIIDDTIELRKKYIPSSKIAVLSNATLVSKKEIKDALLKIDFNILKLDSAREETIRKINCPLGEFSLEKLIDKLHSFKENLTIQTLFVKGKYKGYSFDNSSDEELKGWLRLLKDLHPKLVMVYTIARDAPIETIEKISEEKLHSIASKVRRLGIPVTIST